MSHSGDISVLAMIQFKADLAAGNFDDGICFCFELARLLAYHRQLHDLWHFQINVRKALIEFLDGSVTTAIEQSTENHPAKALDTLRSCHDMLDVCTFTGIFDNVAYRQDLDSIPSTIRIQGMAAATWKRYMRRRITAFNKKKEIEMVEEFDHGFASLLQARVRRLQIRTQHYLPLAARRALAQIQYFELPAKLAGAAATLQGLARTKLLYIRLSALRDACIDLPVPTVARLRRLKPDEREQLIGHFDPSKAVPPKDNQDEQISNVFQQFLQARAAKDSAPKEEQIEQEASKSNPVVSREGEIVRDGNEVIVGVDQAPFEGLRVVIRKSAIEELPELLEDSGGGAGTITWVDPEDLDGDGVTGDICEVEWDRTGLKGDYRTGYEGQFRLAVVQDFRNRAGPKKDEDGETVVGRDVTPEEGMRVVLRAEAVLQFPEILADSAGGPGTITWVDPEDLDGDGVTGDICEVRWDKTRTVADYRTGYEGDFRLALFKGFRSRPIGMGKDEVVVGMDVTPVEGMRVVLLANAIKNSPELLEDSGGGAGIITWVDPEDLDGDGVPGDICEVEWEQTGVKADYRTGFEGEFRLALTYDVEKERAGQVVQRVFRGHRERAALRAVLMAEFLRVRELELAYQKLGAAVLIQNAIRCHHSRSKWRFRETLRAYRVREREVGADRHSPVPVRLQAVYRAHLERLRLRAALLARLLTQRAEQEARGERAQTEAQRRHRRLRVSTRYKMRFWWWYTRMLRRFRSVGDRIAWTQQLGYLWQSLGQWKQHSIDAKRRVVVARLLAELAFQLFFFRPRAAGAARFWGSWARWQVWLHQRDHAIRAGRRRRMQVGVLRQLRAMVARAKRQLGSGFKLRSRSLFRLCTLVFREWHVTAWRRLAVRRTGALLLPTWVEFLRYRCFRALKLNTEAGWMAAQEGDISSLKLKAAFVPISKVTSTSLRRLSSQAPPRTHKPLQHWEDDHEGVQLVAAKRAALREQREQTALEANEALFTRLRAAHSEGQLMAATQPRLMAATQQTAATTLPGSSGEASASVRVRLPRSKRQGRGGGGSRVRAKSAAEVEGDFWQQRTRALMESPTAGTAPLKGAATVGAELLRRAEEWTVVDGTATSSLLRLLLPDVHQSPTGKPAPIRAWPSPAVRAASSSAREGAAGAPPQDQDSSLPAIRRRLAR